jgi:CRISPR-associated endonuclease Cas2
VEVATIKTAVLLSYDLVDDNRRRHLARRLADMGLQRLQASVWCGWIPTVRIKELNAIAETIGVPEDAIILLPVCKGCCERACSIYGKPLPEHPPETEVW